MKILITTDYYLPAVNGVVTSVVNLKKELEHRGHDVRILTLSPNHHSYIENDVYYIGSLDISWFYPNTRFKLHLRRHILTDIQNWKPDIVHSQCEFSTYSYAKKISRHCKAPLIHTYHTVYEDYTHYFCPSKRLGKNLVSMFSRHILDSTDLVIAPSQKVDNLLKDYHVHTPISVVPTGIDIDRFAAIPVSNMIQLKKKQFGISEYDLTLLYIGRLAKEKNLRELLSMVAKINDLPVKLLIVGDGPDRHDLEEFCKVPELRDKVSFVGMIAPSQVNVYYHLGDVFVNTSTSETQGLTYIEAMAAGLPMLCKKDRCLDDLIIDGCNGWQFTSEAEFEDRVRYLYFNSSLRREMGDFSATHVRKFSTQHFAEHMEELYRTCC